MNGIGALLILVGFGGLGFGALMGKKHQIQRVQGMVQGLAYIEREISFHLTPLPDIYKNLSTQLPPPLCQFFQQLAKGMSALETQGMGERWCQGLSQLYLGQGGEDCLVPLGQVLGCYDAESQSQAILQAKGQLEDYLQGLEEESCKAQRLYGTLSLGLGGLLVIVLL